MLNYLKTHKFNYMKKLLTTLLLCTVVIITNAQTTHFDSLYYKDNAYQFNDSVKITRDNIFTTYKNQFGLGTNDSMGDRTNPS